MNDTINALTPAQLESTSSHTKATTLAQDISAVFVVLSHNVTHRYPSSTHCCPSRPPKMANTAPKIPEVEREEPAAAVDRKAQLLADRISGSRHLVVFTGAGVSTSAGIADFRGPEGAWTLMAQGRERDLRSIDTLQAIPTPTHMALVELQNRAVLKYLISQNCDGLHRRSGILPVGTHPTSQL